MTAIENYQWGESAGADRVWSQVCGLRPDAAPKRLFMVLQAYMDESFDVDGTVVIAGYISTAERWAAFSREWEQALRHGVLDNSDKYRFKMSEMAMSPERMARVPFFHRIIHEHAIMGTSFAFNKNDLERASARISIDHASYGWTEPLTPYFMAFRLFIDCFHSARIRQPELFPIEGTVDFYFDDRAEKGVILGFWDEYLAARAPAERAMYGATPRFECDDDFLPLQAADFHAWWVRKMIKECGMRKTAEGLYEGLVRSPKKIPHVFMEVDEDGIANILKRWLEDQIQSEYFVVRDSKPEERIDPPFPVERLFTALGGLFSRISRKSGIF
jgi:hypothetical protein